MHRTCQTRGFTLLETVVWITLFTFTMGALVSSMLYFYRANRVTLNQASAVYSAQRGVDDMVRTIREAAYASDGAFPVATIADNDFTFYADVDSDPFIERVRYYLSGTDIIETIVDPSGDPPTYSGSGTERTVSDYVRNTAESLTMFTYFDETGTQVTDYSNISDVRFVTVNIAADLDPDALPNAVFIRSSAALRNLIGE
jgi:type II secretory pathway pseudopilin PulG